MQGRLLAGRYRLVDTIGNGGMGRVWRAHDEVLHRAVAVKELTAALYASEPDRARLFARTDAEARAAARINHSAVVTVHDVLDHDQRPWIVMELVEGESLADAVRDRGRVEPREAARIGLWVLRALKAAHSAGVLHRDVKPGNVLLGADGRVLLTDFGIAQLEGDTTLTRTGEIVGSVDYIAPERVRGEDPGPGSDLWALGATLYTAVEGKSPFRRTTPLTTMQAVVDEDPPDPSGAGPLAPVISALLRKDPAERPDAAEAERLLAEAAAGRTPDPEASYAATRHLPQDADATPSGAHARSGNRPGGPDPSRSGHHTHPSHGAPPAQGTAPGTAQHPGPGTPAPAGQRRRRGRTVALVVVLAALVGGGSAWVMQYVDQTRRDSGTQASEGRGGGEERQGSEGSSGPAPDSSPSDALNDSTPPADLPDGWTRVKDERGFSVPLPEGWEREEVDANQVDYTPDGGRLFVRIAVDESPDFDSPYRHLQDLERQLGKLVEYERQTLEERVYRDRPAAFWDFTWTALAKDTAHPGPRRAVELLYFDRLGTEYAIYMSGPADEWETTRKHFDTILRGWRPPGE